MRAVVDRFAGDYAVLLVGDDEVKVDFPKGLLPQGTEEGTWLKVSFEIDYTGTQRKKEEITNLLEKLKNKNK